MKYEYLLERCQLCPRECSVNRNEAKGFCGEGRSVRIARAEKHMWEEPCISGENGSGAVFFSGCNLKCCYCQNFEISHLSKGFKLSDLELAQTFLRLKTMGAENINLVNPTHFVPQILNALELVKGKLNIPIVYNSGGYEKSDTLELLKDYVQIFLPDLKYFDPTASKKYSSAKDYFEHAFASISKMVEIAGKPSFENGRLKSGVLVRHMVLPNMRRDSIKLIEILSESFEKDEILVSLMSQYTPVYKAGDFDELNRCVSTFEYNCVVKELEKSGFDGYIQQRESSSEDFIPKFYDEKYY